MSAAPAYQRYSSAAYERAPQQTYKRAPRIQVVPGRGPQPAAPSLSPSVVSVAVAIAAVLVVLALVGVARVALTSATVTMSMQAQELTNQIDSARNQGNQLEVTQSSLANPTRVKVEAGALGMVAPGNTATIILNDDVVATDGAGNLSLTQSLRLAAAA